MRDLAMIEAIGELDYVLSRLLLMSEQDLDEINWRTMKHHAEDMAGAAEKIMSNLRKTKERHPEWDHAWTKKATPSDRPVGLTPEEREEIDSTP